MIEADGFYVAFMWIGKRETRTAIESNFINRRRFFHLNLSQQLIKKHILSLRVELAMKNRIAFTSVANSLEYYFSTVVGGCATKRKATWQEEEKYESHNSRMIIIFFHIKMQIDIDFLIWRSYWLARAITNHRLLSTVGILDALLPIGLMFDLVEICPGKGFFFFFFFLALPFQLQWTRVKNWNFWKNLLMLEANIIDIVVFDKFTPFTMNMNTMNIGTSCAADLNLCRYFLSVSSQRRIRALDRIGFGQNFVYEPNGLFPFSFAFRQGKTFSKNTIRRFPFYSLSAVNVRINPKQRGADAGVRWESKIKRFFSLSFRVSLLFDVQLSIHFFFLLFWISNTKKYSETLFTIYSVLGVVAIGNVRRIVSIHPSHSSQSENRFNAIGANM